MKLGLIADTHIPGTTKALWPQIIDAFSDVDKILHAGDLWTVDVIDELTQLAPTHVATGNGDLELTDERLKETWQLQFDDVAVGLVHEFPTARRRPADYLMRRRDKLFQAPLPNVVIYGHTHYDEIHLVGELMCVNPGSPTLPRNQDLRHGTLGFLEIEGCRATATISQITDNGIETVQEETIDFV